MWDWIKRLALAAWLVAILPTAPCLALDQERAIGQFQHTSWTEIDGHSLGVWAMAQTRDGYLWLGTSYGLFRFDGVRFERYRPLHGQLYGLDVTTLRALPSGELWIGYQKGGISVLRDGNLITYTPAQGAPAFFTTAIANDPEGNIWVATYEGLLRFDGRHWQRVSRSWNIPDEETFNVVLGRDGTLWVSTSGSTYFLRRGLKRFEKFPQSPVERFAASPDGRVWATNPATREIRPVTARDLLPAAPGTASASNVHNSSTAVGSGDGTSAIIDRDGSLWTASIAGGLVRIIHPGSARTVQKFGFNDGLTSDKVKSLLEDREGNIWVGTNLGLDRFRAADVVAETLIPQAPPYGFRTALSGSTLFVAGGGELFRITPDSMPSAVTRIGLAVGMYADRQGTLWIGGLTGLSKWNGSALEQVALPKEVAGLEIDQIAETADRQLWIFIFGKGVYRQNGKMWVPVRLRSNMRTDAMFYDGRDIWLRYPDGSLQCTNGLSVTSFSSAQSGIVGAIQVIYRTSRGVLFGGERGIALFDGKRFRLLGADRVRPLALSSGIAGTPAEIWINSVIGVVRMRAGDFYRAFDQPHYTPPFKLFDTHDRLPGGAQQDEYQNTAIFGPGGRIWIVTTRTIAWIDPHNLRTNKLPPPVVIRSLTSDDREYPARGELSLPAGNDDVQIDYTALSLTDSARVRFRYRLDGFDRGWVDPGDRRQAFYTNLAPGRYRFRVLASNNSGIWNLDGASFAFVVTPTFVQSDLFVLLCTLGGAVVLWILYSWRVHQLSENLRRSLQDRLAERERIARELHDTLLQGFQGLILKFQVVARRIPPGEPARALAENALEAADRVMIEGRDSVQDIRGTTPANLADVFAATAGKLNVDAAINFRIKEEGEPSALHPVVRDEVAKIGVEAVTNAFRHARPHNINVSIAYARRQFSLSVVDDGCGMSDDAVQSGREGHFGMTGMRERAAKIRATLSVSSHSGAGTRVDLIIPARFAYAATGRQHVAFIRSLFADENGR